MTLMQVEEYISANTSRVRSASVSGGVAARPVPAVSSVPAPMRTCGVSTSQ